MRFDDYQAKAATTAVFPPEVATIYTVLGLTNEAGEVAGALKKFLRGDYNKDELKIRLTGELGDVLWYVAAVCTAFEIDLDGVAITNLVKLDLRSRQGTIRGDGDKR